METILFIGTIYICLGALMPIGQFISAGIGKYVVWDKRAKFMSSAVAGAGVVSMGLIIFFGAGLAPINFPLLIVALTVLGKGCAELASSRMGLDLSMEDVKGRYGHLFRMDNEEISCIVNDDFTRRLFPGRGLDGQGRGNRDEEVDAPSSTPHPPEGPPGDDGEEDGAHGDAEGLRGAVEGFIEKERRRKTKL